MAVDYDAFYQWCVDRFGETNLKVRDTSHGVEICTHSLWSSKELGKEDRKFHLWMSPKGGKKKIEKGAYRCWLTDHKGTLIDLVSKIDGVPIEEAEELILDAPSLRVLEKRLHEFYTNLYGNFEIVNKTEKIVELELPDNCFKISDMHPDDPWRIRAVDYLSNRRMPVDKFYICTENENFGDRIVIPYYNRDHKMVFFNARAINDRNPLRYRKYEKVPEGDVLYMTSWPAFGKVYVMEGEFDAESLRIADLIGCACGGKHLSDAQIELLRPYTPVLAFDADKPGLDAVINIGTTLIERGFIVRYVRPPKIYKDWNRLLQVRDTLTIKQYISKFERPFTQDTANRLKLSSF